MASGVFDDALIKRPLILALKAVEKLCKDGHGEYIHFGPTI